MLDFDLAVLYEVETRILKQAVKRNINSFPEDFMFQLTEPEWEILRSQFVTSSWGGSRYLPSAFTEQGVAMLSGVLNSEKAIEVNIAIIRTFVMIRQYALSNKELLIKLNKLESKYDRQFKDVAEAINYMLEKDNRDIIQKGRKRIGYKTDEIKE